MGERSKGGGSRAAVAFIGIFILAFAGTFAWNEWGAAAAYSLLPNTVSYKRTASSTVAAVAGAPATLPTVRHLKTPDAVKAIYMTQCAVGTPSFRESLVKLIDTTDLNAIVIDIRDFTGKIAFPATDPVLKDMVSETCGAKDMKDFVARLHEKNIYVIGRITVFQNPHYTSKHPEQAVQKKSGGVWKDHKGLSFVDVGAKPYWETVVALSKESYALGFDELNFDYIRFPSDGPMAEAVYTWDVGKSKPEALEGFFKYLHDELKNPRGDASGVGPVLSADLFGMVTTNYDDLNIGQVLERALPYFDFIDPMVYPSHYPSGFNGYKNPNQHSYDIVYFSLAHAVARTVATTSSIASYAYTRIGTSTPAVYRKPAYPASKIRPWLQSFDYPVTYTPAMVREQIKANEDAGLDSYLFWDPANKYRSLKEVLIAQ